MTEYHPPVVSDDEHPEDADKSTRRKGDSSSMRPSGPKQPFPTISHSAVASEKYSAEGLGKPTRRKGDFGLGRPSGPKQAFQPDKLQETFSTESDLEQALDDGEKFLDSDVFWNWFGKPLRGLILPVGAIAGFFVITQTVSFLTNIRQLPITGQIGLGAGLAIFGGLIVWHLIKTLRLWWRLRVSPQVQTRALRELADREALRELCIKNNKSAVDKLMELLGNERTYAGEEFKAALKRLAVSTEEIADFEKRRRQLLCDAQLKSSDEWLDDFKIKIQEPLDKIADRRIKKYYYHAGFMTALSPYPLMDRLIVLRTCLAMLQELLEIYALKPSWGNRLILFAKVILNVYLAGVIDDAVGSKVEAGVNTVIDNIPALTTTAVDKGLGFIASKGAGKGAGMLVQAYMVYRLGNAAQKMLRPIKIKQRRRSGA